MKTRMQKQSEAGVVLMITLGFLIAMAIIIGYSAARAISHSNQLSQAVDYDEAFLALDGAQAAIEAQPGTPIGLPANYRFVDFTSGVGVLNLPPADNAAAAAANVNWQPFGNTSRGTQASYVAIALGGDNDNVDNDVDGVVDEVDGSESGYTSYYMASRVMDGDEVVAYRAAEDTNAPGANVNVWQNAIFADVGQGGALINGNVSIHGSVHLLGNDPNNPVVQALDMSGTSFIHNTYGQIGDNNGGIPADIATRIGFTGDPATSDSGFSFTDDDGDGVADEFTLNGNLRVKNGTIDLGGNSEVGSSTGGSNEKPTMDGVFLADGGGDEVLNGENKIFSDNGYDQSYDLGNLVEFPTYDDDGGEVFVTESYLEGFDAASWTEPDGTVHAVPTTGTQRVFNGNINLTAGPGGKKTAAANNFYWNASVSNTTTMPNTGVTGTAAGTGNMPSEADLAAKIAAGENFIWYDGTTTPPTMIVNGRVPVNGDVNFASGSGQNDTYEYEGKGTVMAVDIDGDGTGGNMNLDANVVTTNFPGTNLLGLMSQNDFAVGDSSQKTIMGGFYAQGTVSLNYQSKIVGTIVGNYFDMGSQVPSIFQVPSLADNWTDNQRMIGSDPITQPVQIGWREYNVRLEAGN